MFSEKKGLLPTWIKKIEEREKIRIIRIKGELDALAVALLERFDARMKRQKGYTLKHVILDFSEVSAIDSAAVAALLRALRECKKLHQKLAIINLKEGPRNMIRLAKVTHLFPSYANEEQAIQELETRF